MLFVWVAWFKILEPVVWFPQQSSGDNDKLKMYINSCLALQVPNTCILFILLFDDVLMHHIWNFREHQLIWKNAYGKTTEAKDPRVEKFEIFAWDSFHQNNNFFFMTHFHNLNTIQLALVYRLHITAHCNFFLRILLLD
jgi:hypothetical protein